MTVVIREIAEGGFSRVLATFDEQQIRTSHSSINLNDFSLIEHGPAGVGIVLDPDNYKNTSRFTIKLEP